MSNKAFSHHDMNQSFCDDVAANDY